MKKIEPYDPCPCGSGKKFKFCCYPKQSEHKLPSSGFAYDPTAGEIDAFSASLPGGDVKEGFRLCKLGLRRMQQGDLEEAIAWFRESMAAMPSVYTPANNLAICLMAIGKPDEAMQVQQESLAASPLLPNPFGLANLATLYLVGGDEINCRRTLDEALTLEMPSEDACTKVCEALARFRRHQDILDLIDASGFDDTSNLAFFSGVAAANLGEFEYARHALRRVNRGFHKADMVRRYLQYLKDGVRPDTIRGDWPYLISFDICPLPLIKGEFETKGELWLSRRIVADFCEALMNETPHNPDNAFGMLKGVKHSEALNLLRLIVQGRFGSDSLRLQAANVLLMRGEFEPGQSIRMFMQGKMQDVALDGIALNPDFRFGGELPEKLGKLYAKTILNSQKKSVNWEKTGQVYLRIMKEAPDYYPARFNYALSLIQRARATEALPILYELVATHPEYLFARGTLLQLLVLLEEDDKADALVKSTVLPKETHPDAYAVWLMGQTLYHEAAGRDNEAYMSIRAAHDIAPHLSTVQRLWQDYEDWEEDGENDEF